MTFRESKECVQYLKHGCGMSNVALSLWLLVIEDEAGFVC